MPTVDDWNPHIEAAAEAMYGRLRIVNEAKYPPWADLDIDAADHYCIAAEKAINTFFAAAMEPRQVEAVVCRLGGGR